MGNWEAISSRGNPSRSGLRSCRRVRARAQRDDVSEIAERCHIFPETGISVIIPFAARSFRILRVRSAPSPATTAVPAGVTPSAPASSTVARTRSAGSSERNRGRAPGTAFQVPLRAGGFGCSTAPPPTV